MLAYPENIQVEPKDNFISPVDGNLKMSHKYGSFLIINLNCCRKYPSVPYQTHSAIMPNEI